jgi:hypothetical protein
MVLHLRMYEPYDANDDDVPFSLWPRAPRYTFIVVRTAIHCILPDRTDIIVIARSCARTCIADLKADDFGLTAPSHHYHRRSPSH